MDKTAFQFPVIPFLFLRRVWECSGSFGHVAGAQVARPELSGLLLASQLMAGPYPWALFGTTQKRVGGFSSGHRYLLD